MKFSKNTIFGLAFLSMMVLISCQQQNPLSSTAQETVLDSESIQLIPFAGIQNGVKKVVSATRYVNRASGAFMNLDFQGTLDYKVDFTVPPNSISYDTDVTINLESEYLSINFYPHGVVYDDPAILNIEAQGLDLSGVPAEKVNLYYDNTDNGTWEKMSCDSIIVDFDNSGIKVVNARIPHFSRYSIGIGN